ncbi:hypothetical protein AY599_18425 [Leptolyngbya valderiana BDU 20041]|nr:hypothetical protein AY599_18425 [Leptolyngbya valderiana BDU 20041]
MAEYYYTDANRNPMGPIPFEELRSMYEQGKLASGALVAEVGATEWQSAAELLRPGSSEPVEATPPVASAAMLDPNDRFEPLAGWAFGLGLASWLCISILGAIPGAILGHMALGKMKRDGNPNQAAKVLAIIGLILSYVQIGVFILSMIVGLLMVFAAAANP